MAKPHIITALDIGSDTVKLLSACRKNSGEGFEVLAQYQEPSLGIRKGVVINVSQVSKTISSLIEKAEQDCGIKIDKVYANIGGGHISSVSSRGLVSVSRADRKISQEDVDRVINAARTLPLHSNKEIIQVFPKEFIVDGQTGVREVVDMEGVRLEAETLLLCGFAPYINNSSHTILDAGLQVNDLIPDPLASAKSVLTPREKELGVCVLDIGSGTTGMAVYEEGSLTHAAVFPVGSGHITNDIAICLKTDIDTAEKIKLEYGRCKEVTKKQDKKSEKNIKLDGEDQLEFSIKLLTDIIDARVSEIFNLAGKELKKISKQGMLPAGIVLTGGGAKLIGIRDLSKKELKLPCRVGKPKEFVGFDAETNLATLCGLVLEGFDIESDIKHLSIKKDRLTSRLKNIFRTFVP
ncbi:cell division protein FtsA [Patescibacteria group bacterium]|nr:cell division protein FtsA [Patescibacteria group bacterium]